VQPRESRRDVREVRKINRGETNMRRLGKGTRGIFYSEKLSRWIGKIGQTDGTAEGHRKVFE